MAAESRRHVFLAGLVMGVGGLAFLASLVWTCVAYLGAFAVVPGPWTAETGLRAFLHNAAWFSLFSIHHSVFARPAAKAWITRVVHAKFERSAYVWVSSILLTMTVWRWMPVTGSLWIISGIPAVPLLALQIGGVILTLYAAAQLGLRDLAGLRPPGGHPPGLRRHGLYGFVRHPIYFAWLLMVWPTPVMTGSRLTFALITTAYLVVAVRFEERSLRASFGPAYDDYRQVVRWRMLPGVY